MSETPCITCRRTHRATLSCEMCFESICADCEQFLETSTFSFLKEVPEELSHTRYCQNCYDATIVPALEAYNEVMDRAKSIYVFFKTQRVAPPVVQKSKVIVKVDTCEDRDETVLRLAFFAAEQGFNAIIETHVVSEKIRNEGYEKKRWAGSAIPAQVDEAKMERFR